MKNCTNFHCEVYVFLSPCCGSSSGTLPTLWVRGAFGIKTHGFSGSEDTSTSGHPFIFAVTSAIKVVRTSWVNLLPLWPSSMASRIRRAILMILSQVPPMCKAWGGSKRYTDPVWFSWFSLHNLVADVDGWNLQLIHAAYEVCTLIRTVLLCWSSYGAEPPQCVDERWCTLFLTSARNICNTYLPCQT